MTKKVSQKKLTQPAYSMKAWVELRLRITERGFLKRQVGFYLIKTCLHIALLVASLWYLVAVPSFWWQLPNMIFLAFNIVQMIGLGHDAGHLAIFNSVRANHWAGVVILGVFGGSSFTWWREKHDEHHAHPNELDSDPDIDFPIVAFSREQALEKTAAWQRFCVKHQAELFPLFATLIPFNMRFYSFKKVFDGESAYPVAELAGMVAHFVVLFWCIFMSLGWLYGSVFFVLLQMVGGLYLSGVFAPNHKGMPILEHNSPLPFFARQIMTSRNIVAHPLTDFIYLGLNYQVEHHLFPSLPRNQMKFAHWEVMKFCREQRIPYHETSIWESFREIHASLKEVSRSYDE